MSKIKSNTKIYIAGHSGMVGSAINRALKSCGAKNIITKKRSELNLINQSEVRDFFAQEQPEQVFLAAAKVGGIHANNTYSADFIYENLMIETNVIDAAFRNGVKKLLFLGSSCIYPKHAAQPIPEQALLTDTLEPTNEAYAIAKIAGIKLCESYNRQYENSHGIDYRSVMPTNLYGPGDHYHPENSHVIPALIQRFHQAKIKDTKTVTIWGTGSPKREFLFVDDLAEACVFIMNIEKSSYRKHALGTLALLNVGFGQDINIRDLAYLIRDIVCYSGQIEFDTLKPDGTPRKLLDSSRLKTLGWRPKTGLKEGLTKTYQNYVENLKNNHY